MWWCLLWYTTSTGGGGMKTFYTTTLDNLCVQFFVSRKAAVTTVTNVSGYRPESLLNLASNSFHFGITRLLDKLYAISLLKMFCHTKIEIRWPTTLHNSLVKRLPVTDILIVGKCSQLHINASPPASSLNEVSHISLAHSVKQRFDSFVTL